jgi:5,10-methylene-tetrahydrofolate dehydrogenase/methenyl tetrahydrofolate cyclohydrolase
MRCIGAYKLLEKLGRESFKNAEEAHLVLVGHGHLFGDPLCLIVEVKRLTVAQALNDTALLNYLA